MHTDKICMLYTDSDQASKNIAACVLKNDFTENDNGLFEHSSGSIFLHKIDGPLLNVSEEALPKYDIFYFLSGHSSSAGVASMTVHAEGNWTNEALLGGKPMELSVATPTNMLNALLNMEKDKTDLEKTYEATHHGPLLTKPSCFIEIGGNLEVRNSIAYAELLSRIIMNTALQEECEFSKIAIGIGGTHYAMKFTKLAKEKGYAFSHMMPKHGLSANAEDNAIMLKQALERSVPKAEMAVIDWKSIKSQDRQDVVRMLNDWGVEYERV